jgi:adenylate cyclase
VNVSSNILDQPEMLDKLRSQAKKQAKSTVLNFSLETLWPLLSNTDMLNQKIGLDATQNSFSPLEQGGSLMQVETKAAGLSMSYQELPFEWLEPHFLSVERIYHQGLFKYLKFSIFLETVSESTQVSCQIAYVPTAPDLLIAPAVKDNLNKIVQFWEHLAQTLKAGAKGVEAFFAPLGKQEKKLESLTTRWQKIAPESLIPKYLARYVLQAPERYAGRIRPFELAAIFDLNPLETLRFCLRASWAGDLHLRWDLRCPGCKGPKENSLHLGGVAHQAYCPSCAAGYQIGFDQNLELTFFPDTALRPLEEDHFCAGSPANTPHLAAQINLWPMQAREVSLSLLPGEYALHSLSLQGELLLRISEQGPSSFELNLDEALPEAWIELSPGARLQLKNAKPYFRCLQIEKTDWDAQVCSAALVSSLQEFRELFATEAPSQALPISRLTILECALVEAGDNFSDEELQALLMQIIEERDGALVHAQAGRARAVFQDPLDAVRAIWTLQQRIQALSISATSPNSLNFRAGIAEGVCETWNHEGSLDYTGEAVEWADFQRELAQAGELIVNQELFNDADLQWFLYRVRAQVNESVLSLEQEDTLTIYGIRFQGGQA